MKKTFAVLSLAVAAAAALAIYSAGMTVGGGGYNE